MPSNKSPSFDLLCLSVRLADPDAAVSAAENLISAGAVDWEDLYERAKIHCIRPQLANLIRKVSSAEVPDGFREKIDDAYRQNLSLQLRNINEFIKVKQILDDAGIEAVPFKGFSLAHEMYGNIADREGGDVDLYINFRDLDRIMGLMNRGGYMPETSSSPAFIRKMKRESAEYNFERYEGDEKVFHVEFHWKIGSTLHGMNISLDDLSSQVVTGTMQGNAFKVFTPSAGLLLALMHHGGKDALVQLKHLLDIGMILKKDDRIDWDWVTGNARRYNIEPLVYVAVRMASDVTGIEIPERLIASAESGKVCSLADGRMEMMALPPSDWYRGRFNHRNFIFHLRSRTGIRLKATMAWDYCRRLIIGAVTPGRLMRFYLKKRYRIESEKI